MDVLEERAVMVRIYVGEADKHGHEALYKHLMKLMRARGLWGATAYRGVMGFGASSVVHSASPLVLSAGLPVVIEAIDREERIEAVIPEIAALVGEGLVVTHEVRIRKHAPHPRP